MSLQGTQEGGPGRGSPAFLPAFSGGKSDAVRKSRKHQEGTVLLLTPVRPAVYFNGKDRKDGNSKAYWEEAPRCRGL